jgi:hypothetical protein
VRIVRAARSPFLGELLAGVKEPPAPVGPAEPRFPPRGSGTSLSSPSTMTARMDTVLSRYGPMLALLTTSARRSHLPGHADRQSFKKRLDESGRTRTGRSASR